MTRMLRELTERVWPPFFRMTSRDKFIFLGFLTARAIMVVRNLWQKFLNIIKIHAVDHHMGALKEYDMKNRKIERITGFCRGGDSFVSNHLETPKRPNEAPKDERAFYVEFELRTREIKGEPERKAFESGDSLTFENFDPRRKTIILIPGATIFGPGYSFYYSAFLSFAFLSNGDYNVISVQWNHLIDVNLIRRTIRNAVFVGELTAALITSLRNDSEVISEFHIVGHHYGTLSEAVAGALLDEKLERLTALDPQNLPLDVELPHWAQLGRSSAEVVEVIHSSGCTQAMGHRDFYLNGGKQPQPGCAFDLFDYCSSEKAFLAYGMDVLFKGKYYNATNCDTYEAYIHFKCQNRVIISLWNTENQFSVPTGKYFFQTSSLEVPMKTLRNTDGQTLHDSFAHRAKQVQPLGNYFTSNTHLKYT